MEHVPTLSRDEFIGLVSCLAQLTHLQLVVQGPAGATNLNPQQFVAVLANNDIVTSELVARWLASSRELREHVISLGEGLLPAEPLRVGICGHVM